MLSKNKIKYLRSLALKKNRTEEHVFVAEGPRLVGELLSNFQVRYIAATQNWVDENTELLHKLSITPDIVNEDELRKVSSLDTPQQVLAVLEQPKHEINPEQAIANGLCLALDDVQNPGNLGTIVRIADWFGIKDIFCSKNTADIYNPKTVQATMGGLARVRIHYVNLPELLATLPHSTPIYGTFLNAPSIYNTQLSSNGIIVMGNEGRGVSEEVEKLTNQRITIPNYPAGSLTTESLNVAIATAIVCAEFRRQQ